MTKAPPPTLLDYMGDPHLFGPHFKGRSWEAWQAFLGALFGLPLSPGHLETFRRCTGRSVAPAAAFAEAALVVGRRGGKSRVLALIAVYLACARDYTPFLAPGEVATIGVLAANRQQARSIFRYTLGLLKAVQLLSAMIEDDNNEQIVLTNRVVIEVATASFRTTRGYSFAAVLCDEIAFWRSEETSANPDTEILRALRPGMASIPGSMLLLASSPYAKKGELYNAYRRHHGKDDARVLVWKGDTRTMNPSIDPAIIAEAYDSDPESARAEYGAEFRDDLADYITREAVDAVTAWGRRELPPIDGVSYSAFCDPSGGVSDAMTLAIAHLQNGNICVLDAVLEVRPPFDPEGAVAECVALLRRYGIARVFGDRYAGLWPKARFREHGIEFEQSARPKSDLYHDLLPLVNACRIELLEHARLSAQLVGLERRTARSGKDSIDHTPGGHDDIANAVAGVLVGLDLDRRPSLVRSSDLLADGAPVPMPKRCDSVFAVMATGRDGATATVYAAFSRGFGMPLVLLDLDSGHLSDGRYRTVGARLIELAAICGARKGSPGVFVTKETAGQALSSGLAPYAVHTIPPHMEDVSSMKLAASVHIGAGRVKLTAQIEEKGRTLPLGGALDFHGGADLAEDPLRSAAVWAVVLGLENEPQHAFVD